MPNAEYFPDSFVKYALDYVTSNDSKILLQLSKLKPIDDFITEILCVGKYVLDF